MVNKTHYNFNYSCLNQPLNQSNSNSKESSSAEISPQKIAKDLIDSYQAIHNSPPTLANRPIQSLTNELRIMDETCIHHINNVIFGTEKALSEFQQTLEFLRSEFKPLYHNLMQELKEGRLCIVLTEKSRFLQDLKKGCGGAWVPRDFLNSIETHAPSTLNQAGRDLFQKVDGIILIDLRSLTHNKTMNIIGLISHEFGHHFTYQSRVSRGGVWHPSFFNSDPCKTAKEGRTLIKNWLTDRSDYLKALKNKPVTTAGKIMFEFPSPYYDDFKKASAKLKNLRNTFKQIHRTKQTHRTLTTDARNILKKQIRTAALEVKITGAAFRSEISAHAFQTHCSQNILNVNVAKRTGENLNILYRTPIFTAESTIKNNLLNMGKMGLRHAGTVLNLIMLGVDIHHEYKNLPPQDGRFSNAIIYGTARFLMNSLVSSSGQPELLMHEYEAPHENSPNAKWDSRSSHLYDQFCAEIGKEKLEEIIRRGNAASIQIRRPDSIFCAQIDRMSDEDQLIYNVLMNARMRDRQRAVGDFFVGIKNTITQFFRPSSSHSEFCGTVIELAQQIGTSIELPKEWWEPNNQEKFANEVKGWSQKIFSEAREKFRPKATPAITPAVEEKNLDGKAEISAGSQIVEPFLEHSSSYQSPIPCLLREQFTDLDLFRLRGGKPSDLPDPRPKNVFRKKWILEEDKGQPQARREFTCNDPELLQGIQLLDPHLIDSQEFHEKLNEMVEAYFPCAIEEPEPTSEALDQHQGKRMHFTPEAKQPKERVKIDGLAFGEIGGGYKGVILLLSNGASVGLGGALEKAGIALLCSVTIPLSKAGLAALTMAGTWATAGVGAAVIAVGATVKYFYKQYDKRVVDQVSKSLKHTAQQIEIALNSQLLIKLR